MPDRYAVIGNPVTHSKSPWIHAEFARQTGQDIDYGRIEAPLEGFEAAVATFRAAGGRGLNVTLPFKEGAYRIATHLSERARAAAAVNTLTFAANGTSGDNTDGVGLVRDLQQNLGFALRGRRVLLVGAGGAAQGVVQPLIAAGVARLVIANRTAERARALAGRFAGLRGCGFGELAEERFELVINATSAGLSGHAPELPPGILDAGGVAYDMVYGRDTPFLAQARALGARACDGLGMLVEQAAESFFIWRGVHPQTAPVLQALRAA
ncbi:MAG: shikimate dehydrogenase [Betaproteobacteria bacterium]|nr:shikimate dehydrogenase [Betaproteobacteria bacterium]